MTHSLQRGYYILWYGINILIMVAPAIPIFKDLKTTFDNFPYTTEHKVININKASLSIVPV